MMTQPIALQKRISTDLNTVIVKGCATISFDTTIMSILGAPYGYDHYGSRGSVGRRSVGML